jgi:cell division protein FtsL
MDIAEIANQAPLDEDAIQHVIDGSEKLAKIIDTAKSTGLQVSIIPSS